MLLIAILHKGQRPPHFVVRVMGGTELNHHGSANVRFLAQEQDIGIRFEVTDI